MEPDEIWRTIVKADEALKYATDDKADRRRQQAVERLREALGEAESIGNEALADQARRRLADLGELEGGARATEHKGERPGERTPRSEGELQTDA
jgi:hypothetical protein